MNTSEVSLQVPIAHGEIERLRNAFNPINQARMCQNAEQMFSRQYPALSIIAKRYGAMEAETLVALYVRDLSEFTGVKEKMSPRQMHYVASIIVSDYGFLTITEIIYFFHLFKGGRFGKFYGSVDGLVITNALQEFMQIRADMLDKIEHKRRKIEQAKERERQKRECLTYEEYQELQWLFNMGYEKKEEKRR